VKSDRWQSLPLKRVVESVQSGTSVNGAPWPADGNQPGVLKTSSVYGGVFDPTENKEVDSYDLDRVSCPVLAGSLIVSRMNTKQHLGVAAAIRQDFPNLYLPDRLWAVTFCGAEPRFIDWWTKTPAYRSEVEAVSVGTSSSMQNISQGDFLELRIELPDLETQHAIADYLDRETALMDTLIEEQQRLIEMLRERRLAVITESVVGTSTTNRLAGASAWYPSLPVGWGRGRVKSIATRVTDGAHISPDTDGGVFDFVSTRDLNGGSIDFDGALKTTPETYEYMVKTGCQPYDGDVLFSKDGTVGETAVVRGGHLFVVASSLVIVSPDRERMLSDYLAYVFASKTAREEAASMMRGAGLPRLSVGNLARLEVPIPPLGEQRGIVAYLDKQTSKIDALILESERFIELARERRVALITAAVTGQIDVREMA
jgi:type I restriction enzyme, S subunit